MAESAERYGIVLTIVTNLRPNSRFFSCTNPPNLPGKCVVCGNSGGDGRLFIDFGFDIDFYGTVYFCSVCLTECCNHLGWINAKQWQALNESNEELISRIQILEADNASLRAAITNINLVSNYNTDRADSMFINIPAEKLHKGLELSRPAVISEQHDNSGSNESSNESGHTNLSDSVEHKRNNSKKSDGNSGFSLDL
jgi:hypothetical protein